MALSTTTSSQALIKGVDKLVRKTLPFLGPSEWQHVQKGMLQLCKETFGGVRFIALAEELSVFITDCAELRGATKPENHRQFVCDKVMTYLRLHRARLGGVTISRDMVVADVGGGNGTMLREMQIALGCGGVDPLTLQRQFYCVETRDAWTETYPFDLPSVQYIFWNMDRGFAGMVSGSVDVVLCMVALHHMSEETGSKALAEMRRIIKPTGVLLVKEHNQHSSGVRQLIECEHWLYHLADCAYQPTTMRAHEFCVQHVANYKNKQQWEARITAHGFRLFERRNRFLDGAYTLSVNHTNPTELYWDVYLPS